MLFRKFKITFIYYCRSKYEEPSLAEGFADIVKVNFVPIFKNSEMERIYKLFLLEKWLIKNNLLRDHI